MTTSGADATQLHWCLQRSVELLNEPGAFAFANTRDPRALEIARIEVLQAAVAAVLWTRALDEYYTDPRSADSNSSRYRAERRTGNFEDLMEGARFVANKGIHTPVAVVPMPQAPVDMLTAWTWAPENDFALDGRGAREKNGKIAYGRMFAGRRVGRALRDVTMWFNRFAPTQRLRDPFGT